VIGNELRTCSNKSREAKWQRIQGRQKASGDQVVRAFLQEPTAQARLFKIMKEHVQALRLSPKASQLGNCFRVGRPRPHRRRAIFEAILPSTASCLLRPNIDQPGRHTICEESAPIITLLRGWLGPFPLHLPPNGLTIASCGGSKLLLQDGPWPRCCGGRPAFQTPESSPEPSIPIAARSAHKFSPVADAIQMGKTPPAAEA